MSQTLSQKQAQKRAPKIVTFADTPDSASAAIAAGADHLLIEDDRLSVRGDAAATRVSTDNDDWSLLRATIAAARQAEPNVRLTVHIDKLCRDRDLPTIRAGLKAAASAGIDAVRFLDGGLINLRDACAPDLAAELATEMGAACPASLARYVSEGFSYVSLSNDWPSADITALTTNEDPQAPPATTGYEAQVLGPVLLQYSDRRQVSAGIRSDANDDPDHLPATGWRAVSVEDRPYAMFDNRHGAFMFNTFDRSLFAHADALRSANLDGWLIDGRCQPTGYRDSAVRAFAALRDGNDDAAQAAWHELQGIAERPFKPGFFLANNTDYCFEDSIAAKQIKRVLADVIDVQRSRSLTLLLRQDWPESGDLEMTTPEGRQSSWPESMWRDSLRDAHGNTISSATAGSVVRLPWQKGMICGSTLLLT